MPVTVVFENEKGFVTDFGAPQFAIEADTKKLVMEIPRFGVWTKSSRDKMEVSFTTNNYVEALRKLGDKSFDESMDTVSWRDGSTLKR